MDAKGISANVSTEPLDEEDAFEVKEELANLHSKCYEIGTMLKLKPSLLADIRAERLSGAQSMGRVVDEWLAKNYNVKKFGEPTWKAVVEAVAHRSGGGNNRLAEEIAKRHQVCGGATSPKPDSSTPAAPPATSPAAPPAASPAAPPPKQTPASFELPEPSVGEKDPKYFEDALKIRTETDGWGSKKLKSVGYEPLQKGFLSQIKFSFGTVVVQGGEKRSIAGSYPMANWPHGLAVIINNETFKTQRNREGTKIDENNLVKILRYLGYKVEVFHNCNAQTILDIMEEYRLQEHWNYDSFICCILSHGKMGQVYGSDSIMVPLDEITNKLSGENCKSLASKPKLFFMQACRGSFKDKGVNVEADDDEMEEEDRVLSNTGVRMTTDSDTKIPSALDFYFGYATASGHVAWRDLDNGSWYISELCRSLASYARFASLSDIMTITNRRVGKEYAHLEYKQSTEVTSRLGNDVFFF